LYTGNSSIYANLYSDSHPSTYDYLKPNGFRFVIKDLPNVSYTCQKVTLPELSIGGIEQQTPAQPIFFPDNVPQFGNFSIEFIVSEDMKNFKELYNWIIALTDNNAQISKDFFTKRQLRYANLKNSKEASKYSDATLFILNSSNNPRVAIKFIELFPTQLSPLTFDTTVDNIQYFVCGASFRYRSYEIETL
jgi:hypothetical protein